MAQNTTEFDRLYNLLNTAQREAVDAIEGPVMVIAGPGTGKTQILTLRIANILRKTDIPADAILALTFTNAAAANMRKRLVSIIGSDAYRVSIFTFHSFANQLIEEYPEHFPSVVGLHNCSEVEKIDIVRSILDSERFTVIKPLSEPYHNVSEILSGISTLKREGITHEDFKQWIENERTTLEAQPDLYHTKGVHSGKMKGEYIKAMREIDKNEELCRLYERYQTELKNKKRYDFDDSLLILIETLSHNENFLRELQEEYQYFLVDEHQDTNGAQNKILELLVSYFDRPNLFVVGDEKQAIFRFQGASLANFLYFQKAFVDVKQVTLNTNYRSHQGILDASHSLIEKNTAGINAPLVSFKNHTEERKPVSVYSFGSDDEELLFLAESVQKKISEGVPPHEIAVLFRKNSDVFAIADYFERLSIPSIIESGHGVLDDPDIRKLNLLLKSIAHQDNDDILTKVLFIHFLNIEVSDIYTIIRHARKEKKSVFEVLHELRTLQLENRTSIEQFVSNFVRWKKGSENESFLLFFETVVRECGILEHIQHSSFHTEKFDKLVRLFDEMKTHVRRNPFFTLTEYETFLTILEEHRITLEAKSRVIPNAVRLMTAHKAKGLEFEYVFIVHATDGTWGGNRSRRYFKLPHRSGVSIQGESDMEDERRLFYVALTRAKKDAFVSYSSVAPDGRDRVPSQFIEEIHADLKKEIQGVTLGYAGKRPPLFVERKGIQGREKYVEFVRTEFNERGISATALTNFLTCPWKWFYENFFHTQFVPSIHQVKGTMVHNTLEDFFNARNTNPSLSTDFLLERLQFHASQSDLEPHTLERIMSDMTQALTGWVRDTSMRWEEKTKNEVVVQGVLLNDVLLTGKFDKLECLNDRCTEVRVVDYKTGKPKSKNEIEGTTESAKKTQGSGSYKRQLVFYAILLDRFKGGQYTMKEAMLDFIEPTESGKYRAEVFEISEEEKHKLEEEIMAVAKQIRTLSFWNERCPDESCTACALRDLMEHSH